MPLIVTDATKRELAYPGKLSDGSTGDSVRRVQEWLTFHDFGTRIDGDFGPATQTALHKFQMFAGLEASGRLDRPTWDALTAPLRRASSFAPSVNAGLGTAVLLVAQAHLKERPIELGGDNRGPWVRMYTGGHDGPEWRWCAGFVSYLIRQACHAVGSNMPIQGSLSCDSLAYQAKGAGLFVNGASIATGASPWAGVGVCQIFLVVRTPSDWTHTGLSFSGRGKIFSTIEGNTDDLAGSSNGYKVCSRSRSVDGKDFIRLS